MFLFFRYLPATMLMKIQVSENIVLRPVEPEDAKSIFDLINLHRDSLRTWLPFVDYTKKWEDTRDFILSVTARHPDEKEDLFLIVFNENIAGLIGFRSTDLPNRRTELGYWIAPVYEGLGLVTKSCNSLIEFCFRVKSFNRIAIRVAEGNTRSSNIPKRLGFKFEGIEREGEYLNNRFVHLEVYSVLKKDWVKKQ